MRLVLSLVGVVLLVAAVMYFLLPAEHLPAFFPGHEDGLGRIRYKHGIVTLVIGFVLIGYGMAKRRGQV
jgi:hypothetical protein